MEWLADCALVHLSNNFSALALGQAFFTGEFFERLPFVGQFLRQFSVSCFCAPFEPSNPSVTANAVKTGNPERSLWRLMRVFGDGGHLGQN